MNPVKYMNGRSIKGSDLQSFGAFLMKQAGIGSSVILGRIREVMETLFNSSDWENYSQQNHLLRFIFPTWKSPLEEKEEDLQMVSILLLKGGTNGEQHNHNDRGSFILILQWYSCTD